MGRSGEKKFYLKSPKATAGGSSSAPPPPWIELPRDLAENILSRLGPVEILKNAQKVCTTWRSVCNEPSMWRIIDLKNHICDEHQRLDIMCRRAVDRSQGELIDINIDFIGTDDLLRYICERSSRLKRLRLGCGNRVSRKGLTASVKHFPELEELQIFSMPFVTARDIEAISICCPKLKSFTFSYNFYMFAGIDDSYALAIAKSMPNLHQLCLWGNMLSNEGVKAIFDGCPNLESLDLRRCYNVDLRGDLGRICSERIKNLKRPFDLIDDYQWDDKIDDYQWGGKIDDVEFIGINDIINLKRPFDLIDDYQWDGKIDYVELIGMNDMRNLKRPFDLIDDYQWRDDKIDNFWNEL